MVLPKERGRYQAYLGSMWMMASITGPLLGGVLSEYTTGFARGAIVHGGELTAGLHFIAKPFTLAQVAAKMSEVLAGRTAA